MRKIGFILSLALITLTSCTGRDENTELNFEQQLVNTKWLRKGDEFIVYDLNNKILMQHYADTPEGLISHMELKADRIAVINKLCDEFNCNGDEYIGKWQINKNTLLGSYTDSSLERVFVEGKIFNIMPSELVIDVDISKFHADNYKRIKRISFIKL